MSSPPSKARSTMSWPTTATEIRERETVRTNEAGSLTFNLVDKIEFCNMYENAQVRVKPSSDVLLQFETGEFACEAQPNAGPVNVLAGPDVELEMSDPQFIVSIGAGGTTIRSLKGRDRRCGASATAPACCSDPWKAHGHRVPGAGVLAPDPRTWEPAEIENPKASLADLSAFKSGLDLSMPDAGGSGVAGPDGRFRIDQRRRTRGPRR